ncbi:alginate lyase family protein [Schlesneria paludicola]|uniref:alginate lyase family protein n=1 Tax=Schlesneria paludicola TaxID=360056 RepID=UPI0012FAD41E|nr:alginate lyase family protein [Schlesneria paludicola]
MLRYFGPSWLMYRVYHAARMKTGLIRRQLPRRSWDELPLKPLLNDPNLADPERLANHRDTDSPRFFFDPTSRPGLKAQFAQWDSTTSPLEIANEVGLGTLRFFSHERVNVGFPPQWHVDPFTESSFPDDRHWSQIADFGAGDIKLVWETNRFGFVFPLVRSYWRTGDEQYAEMFWQLVESWRAANPPESGANWKCGQEISLRVMAWCFGLYGFTGSHASTPARIAMLIQMLAVSGQRIEANIGYALSQKNNHGLSEATGLWTIGGLFPELKHASRWATLGRRLLERQAFDLIYPDGAFSQHSMNYHRVMLHDYLWSIQLGNVLGQPFSQTLGERIAAAGDFVYQVQDHITGRVPCYGQDDGALILPLSNCDYRDFRPVVQAAHYLTTGERRFEQGPWDEDLLWLFEANPTGNLTEDQPETTPIDRSISDTAPSVRHDLNAADGGYWTLRSRDGFAMTRAGNFRHRPAQADLLHVDIWWRGENIAIDPGTFSYNSPPPWDNRLAHTAFHNTVTVDGLDQMERAGRFLWLPWARATSFGRHAVKQGDVACWNGEHNGYRRLPDPIIHRRGLLRLGADHWLVIDSLQGDKPHLYRLHWLLMDAPYQVDADSTSMTLMTSAGHYSVALACSSVDGAFEVARAEADSAVGWRSAYYHSREPAIAISQKATASRIVFATLFGPDATTPKIELDKVQVRGWDWNATISLNLSQRSGTPLVRSIETSGSLLNTSAASAPIRSLSEMTQCTSC